MPSSPSTFTEIRFRLRRETAKELRHALIDQEMDLSTFVRQAVEYQLHRIKKSPA